MDERVKKVISMMTEQLAKPASVLVLSSSVNLSTWRLRQLFRMETGRSPTQHLKDLRMENAKQLLQTTFLTIKEVAFSSGFTDISHFVRDFKMRFGTTPTEYRAQIQSRG